MPSKCHLEHHWVRSPHQNQPGVQGEQLGKQTHHLWDPGARVGAWNMCALGLWQHVCIGAMVTAMHVVGVVTGARAW